jgi:hypothetical protein
MSDFSLQFYVDTDYRYGPDIAEELQNRLQAWINANKPLPKRERVFNVCGSFGIGKTWFLRFIEISSREETSFSKPLRTSQHNYMADYIDLREILGKNDTMKRILDIRKKNESHPGNLCLCIDHVPKESPDNLQLFEEVILAPALEEMDAFLILAQDNRSDWGLIGKVPHTIPWPLDTFREEGIIQLYNQRYGSHKQTKLSEAQRRIGGNPYLATLLDKNKDEAIAIKIFIDNWLKEKGFHQNREKIMEVAFPLSLINPNHENGRLQGLHALQAYIASPNINKRKLEHCLILLTDILEWLHNYKQANGSYAFAPHWERGVQYCLRILFERSNSNYDSQL